MLKTETMGRRGVPVHSLCRGHVGIKAFTKAFKAEGWDIDVNKNSLRHEYWIRLKTRWKKSSFANVKAQPVTVMDWEVK